MTTNPRARCDCSSLETLHCFPHRAFSGILVGGEPKPRLSSGFSLCCSLLCHRLCIFIGFTFSYSLFGHSFASPLLPFTWPTTLHLFGPIWTSQFNFPIYTGSLLSLLVGLIFPSCSSSPSTVQLIPGLLQVGHLHLIDFCGIFNFVNALFALLFHHCTERQPRLPH